MLRLFLMAVAVLSVASLAFATTAQVPEIDVGSASAALALLVGGLALLRERFRK